MCYDNAAVVFPAEKDTLFYHVFQALKTVAPPTATFEMIIPEHNIKKLDEIEKTVDLEYFWNMYAPYRERASSALRTKHEVKLEVARVLIDKEFDMRQKRLYETDPLGARKDLSLIIENKNREQERTQRQQAESRKRREKEELQTSVDRIVRIMRLNGLDDK